MPPAAAVPWDPDLLARVESLEWRSRVLVEGFLQGLHHSPLRGFSSEFAQYHPYMQGEDLRYLDWRAYARLDRRYIREFEAETNLRCQIVVDASASMRYRSKTAPLRKYDYAALLAAAIMRLLMGQNDVCGVSLARAELVEHLPPRLGRLHFRRVLGVLETAQLTDACDLAGCVGELAEVFKRRGVVVIITDAWDEIDNTTAALQRLRFDHHEVVLFQVVDPRELDLAFPYSRLFEDMETGARLPVTPAWNRARYVEAVNQHQAMLQKTCLDLGVHHRLLRTTDAPFEALAAFLAERGRRS